MNRLVLDFRSGMDAELCDNQFFFFFTEQVGPRFQKWQFMDCQDFIVTEKFNLSSNGYGKNSSAHNAPLLKMWAEMWGAEYFPTHDKKEETGRWELQ